MNSRKKRAAQIQTSLGDLMPRKPARRRRRRNYAAFTSALPARLIRKVGTMLGRTLHLLRHIANLILFGKRATVTYHRHLPAILTALRLDERVQNEKH